MNSNEKLIALALATSLVRKLPISPSQVAIATEKPRDPSWIGGEHYVVIPGGVRADGGGHGAQDGGAILRRQEFSIIYYGESKMDQYSLSATTLLDSSFGSMDRFEALRQLFALTFLGNLLNEPMFFEREGKCQWEDVESGVFSREFVWTCMYAFSLPGTLTITDADIQDVLDLQNLNPVPQGI